MRLARTREVAGREQSGKQGIMTPNSDDGREVDEGSTERSNRANDETSMCAK